MHVLCFVYVHASQSATRTAHQGVWPEKVQNIASAYLKVIFAYYKTKEDRSECLPRSISCFSGSYQSNLKEEEFILTQAFKEFIPSWRQVAAWQREPKTKPSHLLSSQWLTFSQLSLSALCFQSGAPAHGMGLPTQARFILLN